MKGERDRYKEERIKDRNSGKSSGSSKPGYIYNPTPEQLQDALHRRIGIMASAISKPQLDKVDQALFRFGKVNAQGVIEQATELGVSLDINKGTRAAKKVR